MKGTEPHPGRVLIVDDEDPIRLLLTTLLRLHGFEPFQADNGATGLSLFKAHQPDVVLLDVNMPGMDGIMVLKEARMLDSTIPVIMLTANATIRSAVEAVRNGAYDYVAKPFANDDLLLAIRRAVESRRLRQENQRLRSRIDQEQTLRELMGSSDAIGKVIADVERVAPTDFTVVVSGETGSGKELIARAIHRLSQRATAPFVPVDCGAIQPTLIESELFGHERGAFTGADKSRPGKFEAAGGGTLFLDEIQNLPIEMQTKLLRALQERQVCRLGGTRTVDIDIRVIAATNQDLAALAAAGRFRQDLYHRLHEFAIRVPPLRERGGDILYLAKRFIDLTCVELKKDVEGITSEALDLLLGYPWPGNVRELRNVIRRSVLLADHHIEPPHLSLQPSAPGKDSPGVDLGKLDGRLSFKEIVRRKVVQVEREIIFQALKQAGGNKAKAARVLQIDYKTMHTKTKEYGISVPQRDGQVADSVEACPED